tara:strand:- start:6596 stop:6820 length:225 start_codon:yes stop_codon:yes gene_type:complete
VSQDKDGLIKAQNELIGVLFEIIKRLQANNDLDNEYFQIIQTEKRDEVRLNEIVGEKEKNAKTVSKLLEKIESD